MAVVTRSCSPANSVQPVQCGADPASFLQGFVAARSVPSLHASYPHDASQVSASPSPVLENTPRAQYAHCEPSCSPYCCGLLQCVANVAYRTAQTCAGVGDCV